MGSAGGVRMAVAVGEGVTVGVELGLGLGRGVAVAVGAGARAEQAARQITSRLRNSIVRRGSGWEDVMGCIHLY